MPKMTSEGLLSLSIYIYTLFFFYYYYFKEIIDIKDIDTIGQSLS